MGEPAAEAATSERDVLLATKLNVPGLRPDLVPRPRLAQRLDEGWGQGLVLVCAPAGYGKTVLLADWVRRGGHLVARLPLDAGDNDPAGSGGMCWPRWTGCGRGSASAWASCSGLPCHRRSSRW